MSEMAGIIDRMWEGEKQTHAFAVLMWEQRDQARAALRAAQQKLKLYRETAGGEYVGGVEFTALMRQINEALK